MKFTYNNKKMRMKFTYNNLKKINSQISITDMQ
jgi:hypothetical protein